MSLQATTNFDGLSPFSTRYRELLNEIAESVYNYKTLEEAIVAKLAEARQQPMKGLAQVAVGKITTVIPNGGGPNLPAYNAESVRGPSMSVVGVTPINRVLDDSLISPANVGDTCLMVRKAHEDDPGDDVKLIILTEKAVFGSCPENAESVSGPQVGFAPSSAGTDHDLRQMVDYLLAKPDPEINTTDVQSFTSDGTWTKPAGAVSVEVHLWAGGGGGGGGVGGSAGTGRIGATGGGAGAYRVMTFLASELGSSVSVTVGAGGSSGAGGNSASGSNGGVGGSSSFGSHATVYGGGGGKGGVTGQVTAAGGSGGGTGSAGTTAALASTNYQGGGPGDTQITVNGSVSGGQGGWGVSGDVGYPSEYGGAGGGGRTGGAPQAGGSSVYAAGGGGGAGTCTTGNAEQAGAEGGVRNSITAGGGGAGGTSGGGIFAAGTPGGMYEGGGGGAGNASDTGGEGGAGGARGGGGGGGGGGTSRGGAGGAGGRGEVVVITRF